MQTVIPDQIALGRALLALRERRGLSRVELATRLNIEPDFVSANESGQINIRWQTLMDLLRALDATISDLADELPEPPLRDR